MSWLDPEGHSVVMKYHDPFLSASLLLKSERQKSSLHGLYSV